MSVHRFWLITNGIWSFLLLAWTAVVTFEPGGLMDRVYMDMATRHDWKLPGYHRYVTRYPFAIVVANTFPRDKYFNVFFYDTPGIFLAVDEADVGPGQELFVGVGDHFSFSCDYSVVDGQAVVRELSLNRAEGEWLTDLNADGQFDMRNLTKQNGEREVAVLFNHSWLPIMDAIADPDQDLYHKRLVTGESVVFDQTQGKWVLDASEQDHRPEKKPEGE
jgi:hypothetical protein